MNGFGLGCVGATQYVKAFAIAIPPAVRTKFLAPSYWFDSDGFLQIYIEPGEFSPKDIVLGSDGSYEVTFRRLRKRGSKIIRGYQITVAQSYSKIYYLVEHMAKLCSQVPHVPVQVKDYILPEGTQFAAALITSPPSEPFTFRAGTIYEVTPSGGLGGTTGDNIYIGEGRGGFTFIFQEAQVTDASR